LGCSRRKQRRGAGPEAVARRNDGTSPHMPKDHPFSGLHRQRGTRHGSAGLGMREGLCDRKNRRDSHLRKKKIAKHCIQYDGGSRETESQDWHLESGPKKTIVTRPAISYTEDREKALSTKKALDCGGICLELGLQCGLP